MKVSDLLNQFLPLDIREHMTAMLLEGVALIHTVYLCS